MSLEYTKRELELIFNHINEKLDDIRRDIRETNKHFDVRLSKVENKVTELDAKIGTIDAFKSKALAVWSVGIVVIGYLLNRFV
jgi:hypothetical protein